MSFDVIIPFLKPIKHMLEAETVSEIMVNPDSSVWIEEDGRIQLLPCIRFDDGALQTGLEVIANRFGKKLDADSPKPHVVSAESQTDTHRSQVAFDDLLKAVCPSSRSNRSRQKAP